ncbi:hypothetical protein ACG7TL_004527 [Trametes sanguinea]
MRHHHPSLRTALPSSYQQRFQRHKAFFVLAILLSLLEPQAGCAGLPAYTNWGPVSPAIRIKQANGEERDVTRLHYKMVGQMTGDYLLPTVILIPLTASDMAYNYYQTTMPGWGTQQCSSSLGRGYDFYNAHAINPEPSLYESIVSRLRDFLGMGIGHHEARHWHRRVYSGLVPLNQLLPADIGAAAAYEAYRTWKHNSFLYEPLSADRERQREGLIGMAIAETGSRSFESRMDLGGAAEVRAPITASRRRACLPRIMCIHAPAWYLAFLYPWDIAQLELLYSGRPLDTYGLRNACEAAASAAYNLADRLFGWTSGGIQSGGYASSYSGSAASNDAYAYEDPYRGRRSRHNSFTAPGVVRSSSPYYGGSPLPAAPMPIPGAAASTYGAYPGGPASYGATPGYAGSYAYGGASPNPYGVTPYAGASAYPAATTAYPTAGYGAPGYGAAGYGAAGYGAAGYGTTAGGGVVLPDGQYAPPGSTVIVTKGRSRRHSSSSSGHHHHHHHRHRSSSRSRYDDYGY